MTVASTRPHRQSAAVLTKALMRAAGNLGMAQRDLASVLGVSESSVSRLRRGRTVDPRTKEGEIAILFLRMYRSLDALVGGSDLDARRWMHAANRHLGDVPAELIRNVAGLARVADYLDAMRGKS